MKSMKEDNDFDQVDESTQLNDKHPDPNVLIVAHSTKLSSSRKNEWLKPMRGFLFGIASEFCLATSNIFMKKTELYSDIEQALARYILQLFTMFAIMHFNGIKLLPCRDSVKKLPMSVLMLRGAFGTFAILLTMRSLKLINPSDTIALVNLNVVFVAILARCFLPDEKLTVFHILSIPFVLLGML